MTVIREENPSYFDLLLRKTSKVKRLETVIFVVLVLVLGLEFGYPSPIFNYGAFVIFFLIFGFQPFVYRAYIKPKYVLTDSELMITKGGKEKRIPLIKVKRTNDIKYFYIIDDKKTPLSVSDQFLDDLERQLNIIHQKK